MVFRELEIAKCASRRDGLNLMTSPWRENERVFLHPAAVFNVN